MKDAAGVIVHSQSLLEKATGHLDQTMLLSDRRYHRHFDQSGILTSRPRLEAPYPICG